MMTEPKQIEVLKELWYRRNPSHDLNANSGEDMFWGTVLCVFNDFTEALGKTRVSGQSEQLGFF